MNESTKRFLWGMVAGFALAAIVKTATFKKGCATIMAGGMQLRDDAQKYFENIREDAEDVKAERDAEASQA